MNGEEEWERHGENEMKRNIRGHANMDNLMERVIEGKAELRRMSENKLVPVSHTKTAADVFNIVYNKDKTAEEAFNIVYDKLNTIIIDKAKPTTTTPKTGCCNSKALKIHVRLRRDVMKENSCSCIGDHNMIRRKLIANHQQVKKNILLQL